MIPKSGNRFSEKIMLQWKFCRAREIWRGSGQIAANSRTRIVQPPLTFLLFSRTQHCVALQHDDGCPTAAYLPRAADACWVAAPEFERD